MRNAWILPLFLAGSSLSFAGAFFCPDATYVVNPIANVSGGVVSSCGNANVTADSAFAATPGNGTVAIDDLTTYLNNNLNAATTQNYVMTEGSAVLISGFVAPKGATLSFTWDSNFEEGGTGSLFYILNGSLTVLDRILPEGQSLPGARHSGSEVLQLLEGSNTFAFGAVSISNLTLNSAALQDPSITLQNMAVNTAGVPEPGTFAISGLGLLAAGFVARRRAK